MSQGYRRLLFMVFICLCFFSVRVAFTDYWGTNGVSFINNLAITSILEKELSRLIGLKK